MQYHLIHAHHTRYRRRCPSSRQGRPRLATEEPPCAVDAGAARRRTEMPLPRYTLRQLEAFATVAELLSFTDAADRLALTPSAVRQLLPGLQGAPPLQLFQP